MKALISFSGGLDSTTVLYRAISEGRDCSCFSFLYGSKHNPYENEAAKRICELNRIPFQKIDLSEVGGFLSSHLLCSGGDIPEGHYQDETMKLTVVPGRNLIFISVLAAVAESIGAGEVWLGIHAGDHQIYPDCRPYFLEVAGKAVGQSTEGKVTLKAPFLFDNKGKIIEEGLRLSVPYELTRTCYKDQEEACGRCGSCQERLEAFEQNGIRDPLKYSEK